VRARGEDGKVIIELEQAEAVDLDDVLRALSGDLYRFLPDVFRTFSTRLTVAASEALPTDLHGDPEDQAEWENGGPV
jgi:hypothetical protein